MFSSQIVGFINKHKNVEVEFTITKKDLTLDLDELVFLETTYFTDTIFGINQKVRRYYDKTCGWKPLNYIIVKKDRLLDRKISDKIKFKVSTEDEEYTSPKRHDISKSELQGVTIKIRHSYIIKSVPNWRLDHTFSKTFESTNKMSSGWKNLFSSNPYEIKHNMDESFELEYVRWGSWNFYVPNIHKIINTIDKNSNINEKFVDRLYMVAGILNYEKALQRFNRGQYNFKYLLPSAIELTKWEYYRDHFDETHMLSDKLDGDRCLIFLAHDEAFTLSLGGYEVLPKMETKDRKTYIFDGEKIGHHYYIYHILMYENVSVHEHNETLCNNFLKMLSESGRWKKEFTFVTPDTGPLTQSNIRKRLTSTKSKPKDGVIIYTDRPMARRTTIKWKPDTHSSADFVAYKVDSPAIRGRLNIIQKTKTGQHMYALMCSISKSFLSNNNLKLNALRDLGIYAGVGHNLLYIYRSPMFPTVPCYVITKEKNLHKKIIELNYDPIKNHWIYMRTRDDKISVLDGGGNAGNNILTVNNVLTNKFFPFEENDLYHMDNSFTDKTIDYKLFEPELDGLTQHNVFLPTQSRLIMIDTYTIPYRCDFHYVLIGTTDNHLWHYHNFIQHHNIQRFTIFDSIVSFQKAMKKTTNHCFHLAISFKTQFNQTEYKAFTDIFANVQICKSFIFTRSRDKITSLIENSSDKSYTFTYFTYTLDKSKNIHMNNNKYNISVSTNARPIHMTGDPIKLHSKLFNLCWDGIQIHKPKLERHLFDEYLELGMSSLTISSDAKPKEEKIPNFKLYPFTSFPSETKVFETKEDTIINYDLGLLLMIKHVTKKESYNDNFIRTYIPDHKIDDKVLNMFNENIDDKIMIIPEDNIREAHVVVITNPSTFRDIETHVKNSTTRVIINILPLEDDLITIPLSRRLIMPFWDEPTYFIYNITDMRVTTNITQPFMKIESHRQLLIKYNMKFRISKYKNTTDYSTLYLHSEYGQRQTTEKQVDHFMKNF